MNPILYIDGYKLDHRRQYPEGTTRVYANWTPRGSRIKDVNKVVFFGLQYFIQKYLMEEMNYGFFDQPLDTVLDKYQRRLDSYLGPNDVGTTHIEDLHKLGYLPLRICAWPEGSLVPLRVPMLTIENTHPDFFWLPNYFETLMSSVLWDACTSPTLAKRYYDLFKQGALITEPEAVDFALFQGHDFSMRGMEGPEAAALSGAGHLLPFRGTDTLPAIDLLEYYYTPRYDTLIGCSVPATEHSVMCAGGEMGEEETFRRLLKLYPKGILSVVSDTWDFWHVLTSVLPKLKNEIMARDGKLVIRPDSGDPVKILCGDPDVHYLRPEYWGAVRLLDETFGHTITSTGYKKLDSHVGVIYGDSITFERALAIQSSLMSLGLATTNWVAGIGSFTYQYNTRDTFGFALKSTWCEINEKAVDIFKKPATDDGTKHSACGRLAVIDGQLIQNATPEQEMKSQLQPVWVDGDFVRVTTLDQIREVLGRG